MAKVLIIEDDVALACALQDWFTMEKHQAEVAHDGTQGLELLQTSQFELALIDWQLPGIDGVEVIARHRESGGRVPIVMLTGKSSIDDKSVGFEVGADDYLAKPFDMRELSLRVNAILRRVTGTFSRKKEIYGLTLDRDACAITIKDRTVKLMPKEFDLLDFLLHNPDNYFTGDQLLSNVWGTDAEAGTESVRSCINRLRGRVDMPGQPSIIESSKGWGYKISDAFIAALATEKAANP